MDILDLSINNVRSAEKKKKKKSGIKCAPTARKKTHEHGDDAIREANINEWENMSRKIKLSRAGAGGGGC